MLTFKTRSEALELMDLDAAADPQAVRAYDWIERVNRLLGGTRVILTHLKRFSNSWPKDQAIQILDVGCGSADIPRAVADWARGEGFLVSIVALDSNPAGLRTAKIRSFLYPEISFLQANSARLPFPPASFDYVLSSMFFHHLADDEAAETLKQFDRIARRGIIVNDLVRSPAAWAGIYLFSRFVSNPHFRNDAPLSVLRGFRAGEVDTLIERSCLRYLKSFRHFAFRFAIAGEKNGTP